MTDNKWPDLAPRLMSGAAMIVLGLGLVWIGGYGFHILVALVCGAMIWELAAMLDQPGPGALALAAVSGITVLAAAELPFVFGLMVLFLPALIGFRRVEQGSFTFATFSAVFMLAGFGMMAIRDDFGLMWMCWLVAVVVATDIAGYFAGRMIGGPKLWPAVTPSKTWAGTTAGWVAAAIVGLLFTGFDGVGAGVVLTSIAVSMASQAGDIAESALKRQSGVKDSSQLIPGHGGVMDRFDGMIGGSLLVFFLTLVAGFPHNL